MKPKEKPPHYRGLLLGYLDSNQEQKNQNLPCCQLHHTPPSHTEAEPTVYFTVRARYAKSSATGGRGARETLP